VSGGFAVVSAHLDHRLREGSRADAAFCRRLCRRLGIPLRTGRADVRARARRDRGGLEEAARIERYAFLRRVKEREGAAAIAVGHTRDDQAETFLLRLLRGSGPGGLACMRPRAGDLLRPLLEVSRAEVIDHLRARGLAWREDPTNADATLLRNRVRNELLPYLEARFNPAVRESLARSAALLADESALLAPLVDELCRQAVRREGEDVVVSRAPLAQAPRGLARLAVRHALAEAGGLRGVTAAHVERLCDLLCSTSASGRILALPARREAVFHFDEVRLSRVAPAAGPAHATGTPCAATRPSSSGATSPSGTTLSGRR
jgi:tRNA(Ile)-lysidine synthase